MMSVVGQTSPQGGGAGSSAALFKKFYNPYVFVPSQLDDVTAERFMRATVAVLKADSSHGDVQRTIVANALTATMDDRGDEVSPAYDKGFATLIGQAWAAGCGIYEPLRESVLWAETDRLLVDSWVDAPTTDDSLMLPAGWSWNRENYHVVDTGSLPVPVFATADSCPTLETYQSRSVENGSGFDEAGMWKDFTSHVSVHDSGVCSFHQSFDVHTWRRAVEGAALLRHKFEDWTPHNIYRELITMFYCSEPLPPAARLAWLLLSQPIVWNPETNTIVQGEHLAVGAQLANTPHIFVYEQTV